MGSPWHGENNAEHAGAEAGLLLSSFSPPLLEETGPMWTPGTARLQLSGSGPMSHHCQSILSLGPPTTSQGQVSSHFPPQFLPLSRLRELPPAVS